MKPAGFLRKEAERSAQAASSMKRDRGDKKNNTAFTTYLHPGQVFVSTDPYAVTTILGSCVAVCIHDVVMRIGGIAHYLLPHRGGHGLVARFGDVAIRNLIDGLLRHGSQRCNLKAKIFGGACVVHAFRGKDTHLGIQNLEVARKLLTDEGVEIVAEDSGGLRARKLIFHLDDGTVWVKELKGE